MPNLKGTTHVAVDVVHEGYLSYNNKNGKQRKKWFVLDGTRNCITRYPTSDRIKIHGRPIPVYGARVERLPDMSFAIQLSHAYNGNKLLKYTTSTAEEKEIWMKALINCINGTASSISKRMCHRGILNGQYVFVRELGRGASGVVYLYTYHGKPYAVKKLTRRATKVNRNVSDDVKREIALLKKVTNMPHIVSLYDVIQDNEDGSDVYLVMEFLGGGPIAEYDKSQKRFNTKHHMGEEDFKRLMRCATIGLKYLHGHRLVHRDIKPDNILMTDDFSECKLADLGVAHWFDSEATSVDCSHEEAPDTLRDTKGTYEFMSPEAISGEDYSGFSADIWALGVTLYALVVGKLPFQADNILALFDQISQNDLSFPPSVSRLSPSLIDLITQMLKKNPKDRITLAGILEHSWLSSGATKAYLKHSKASSVDITLEDADIHGAVSPLQLKFDMMRRASPTEQLALLSLENPYQHSNTPYTPHPIDIEGYRLSPMLQSEVNKLAHQLHFQWCFQKVMTGWQYGPHRNDEMKIHPLLRPYHELDATAKGRNLASVTASLKCILALGYTIERKNSFKRMIPMSLSRVALSGELIILGDLLAENDHEVWANEYIQNGWKHGPMYNNETKEHPAIVPYPELSEFHRDSTRLGAINVIKTLVGLKYTIDHSHFKYYPVAFPERRRANKTTTGKFSHGKDVLRFVDSLKRNGSAALAEVENTDIVWSGIELILRHPHQPTDYLFPPALYPRVLALVDDDVPDLDQTKELFQSLAEPHRSRFHFTLEVLVQVWDKSSLTLSTAVDRFAPLVFRDSQGAFQSISHMQDLPKLKKCLTLVLQHLKFITVPDEMSILYKLADQVVHDELFVQKETRLLTPPNQPPSNVAAIKIQAQFRGWLCRRWCSLQLLYQADGHAIPPRFRWQYLNLAQEILNWPVERIYTLKSQLKRSLKSFDEQFELQHGHPPDAIAKRPMETQYEIYHFFQLMLDYQDTVKNFNESVQKPRTKSKRSLVHQKERLQLHLLLFQRHFELCCDKKITEPDEYGHVLPYYNRYLALASALSNQEPETD